MPATVLIVANDPTVTEHLTGCFPNKKEFSVSTASSGRSALIQAKTRMPDAILVDATSTRLSVKRLMRSLKNDSHAVLILLANNPNRVEGGSSAHLVLPKTITPKRLVEKVRKVLDNRPPREMRAGNLLLNTERRQIWRGSRTKKLTPKEFQILRLLMLRPGQIVSRETLMKEIWHTDFMGDTRTLDVHVRWLRQKVEENPANPRIILTMRGEGYRLEVTK